MRLDNGDQLPPLSFNTVADGRLSVPQAFNGNWGVFLIYRAHWCSHCVKQLSAFETQKSQLAAEKINTIAASVDTRANAEETADRLGLSYPVGYELPMLEVGKRFGCYYEKRRSILNATGFLVWPSGKIAVACYSSGPIGRLEPDAVVKAVRLYKQNAAG